MNELAHGGSDSNCGTFALLTDTIHTSQANDNSGGRMNIMRLKSVRVQLFRNVVDSEEIDIDPQVTCFVGKNESGKTALLNALYRLNPVHTSTTFQASKDYPRWRLSKDRKAGDIDDAVPVAAVFHIEEADRDAVVDAFGEGVLTADTFAVSKSYSGDSILECSVDHERALKNVFETLETPKCYAKYWPAKAWLESKSWPTDLSHRKTEIGAQRI
ncbi:AAA family ATPase [Arthrobacter sp. FX8]|uniref:AAA family ATPase n=1 Tax=Arthrobacter sp. FX8 TaxID=2997335 RepID=UPI00227C6198|nr:AAA family ATPase [Arthrobacter sp. FX8]WAJ34382.1 AAA family ATPase [Arthrobacter sp. FX8]